MRLTTEDAQLPLGGRRRTPKPDIAIPSWKCLMAFGTPVTMRHGYRKAQKLRLTS